MNPLVNISSCPALRIYSDQAVTDEQLTTLITSAYNAQLSMNGPFLSIIVVRNPITIRELARKTQSSPSILYAPVVMCIAIDFAKAAVVQESVDDARLIYESREGFGSAAVDAGLLLAELRQVAAHLGLNTTEINCSKFDTDAVSQLLSLPPLSFPVALCGLGYTKNKPTARPRLPISSFHHEEQWQGPPSKDDIAAFNQELEAYWEQS